MAWYIRFGLERANQMFDRYFKYQIDYFDMLFDLVVIFVNIFQKHEQFSTNVLFYEFLSALDVLLLCLLLMKQIWYYVEIVQSFVRILDVDYVIKREMKYLSVNVLSDCETFQHFPNWRAYLILIDEFKQCIHKLNIIWQMIPWQGLFLENIWSHATQLLKIISKTQTFQVTPYSIRSDIWCLLEESQEVVKSQVAVFIEIILIIQRVDSVIACFHIDLSQTNMDKFLALIFRDGAVDLEPLKCFDESSPSAWHQLFICQ